jgi:hypothetical protein
VRRVAIKVLNRSPLVEQRWDQKNGSPHGTGSPLIDLDYSSFVTTGQVQRGFVLDEPPHPGLPERSISTTSRSKGMMRSMVSPPLRGRY